MLRIFPQLKKFRYSLRIKLKIQERKENLKNPVFPHISFKKMFDEIDQSKYEEIIPLKKYGSLFDFFF